MTRRPEPDDDGRDPTPNDAPGADGRAERGPGEPRSEGTAAEKVDTVVIEDRGQWAVDIIVFFPDSVVRRRVDTYRTRRRAEISAHLIKRGAERELRGPLYG